MIKEMIKLLGRLFLLRHLMTRYIDPNSGGMLFQVLAVIFALVSTAVLFFSGRIRMISSRIRRWIRERGTDDNKTGLGESAVNDPEE